MKSERSRKQFLTLILLLDVFLAFTAAAQNRGGGSVSGVVNDSLGFGVANAEVRILTAQQTNLGVAISDNEGRFRFDDLANGSYIVSASRKDFERN